MIRDAQRGERKKEKHKLEGEESFVTFIYRSIVWASYSEERKQTDEKKRIQYPVVNVIKNKWEGEIFIPSSLQHKE